MVLDSEGNSYSLKPENACPHYSFPQLISFAFDRIDNISFEQLKHA